MSKRKNSTPESPQHGDGDVNSDEYSVGLVPETTDFSGTHGPNRPKRTDSDQTKAACAEI